MAGLSIACAVVLQGSGTAAILWENNVGSIVDNGVGDYTINWLTPFLNANYALAGACRISTAGTTGTNPAIEVTASNPTTTAVRIHIEFDVGRVDADYVSIIAVGDQ